MSLLFLIGLGTASLSAQVRIGGNAAPNAAAVLDLNADDTNSGAKGLALPRVSLTNVSTPLTGTPVVNGMMVYNTNASITGGSGVGIYYWDGMKWICVSDFSILGSTTATKRMALRFDGTNWIADSLLKTVVTSVSVAAGANWTSIGSLCGAGWTDIHYTSNRPNVAGNFWYLIQETSGRFITAASSTPAVITLTAAPAAGLTFTMYTTCVKL